MNEELEYYRLFARALGLTVGLELVVLFLAVRLWFKLPPPTLSSRLLLFAGVFASAGTLPWLWFILPRVLVVYVWLVVGGELLVWAVEALFYRMVLRTGWIQSALLSLACNLVSFGLGWFLI